MCALTPRPFDEDRLVERLKGGSSGALRDAYGHYGDMVYQSAFLLTHSAADASDVLQDVFIALPEAIRSFEGRSDFSRWLKQVAVRAALVKHRARRRRFEVSLLAAVSSLHQRPDSSLLDKLEVERAIAQLSEKLRVVFVLKEIEGYSHREIAASLRIRKYTSEVRLYRARRALRQLLAL